MPIYHYDPPSGSYTTNIPPGTAAFRKVVGEHYGFRTEVIRDQSRCQHTRSEHCECRAVDLFVAAPKGLPLFNWAIAHAETLGIQSVIHNHRVWGFGHWYEHAYTGPSPHTDHVHIGLTIDAVHRLTEQQVRGALDGTEEDELTDEEQKKLEFVYQAVKRDAPGGGVEGIDKWLDRRLKELEKKIDALGN